MRIGRSRAQPEREPAVDEKATEPLLQPPRITSTGAPPFAGEARARQAQMAARRTRALTFHLCGISSAAASAQKSFSEQRKVASPELIPKGFDEDSLLATVWAEEALEWMAQKDALGQDFFLLGSHGPMRRWLALVYCARANREVEYLALTQDTTESDLKQRRELVPGGSAEYFDQGTLKAALHGRVLIVEGLEKAERNVMPVLNNLLENREMALEDGRFLLPQARYAELSPEQREQSRLVPVHPDFRVIALGVPVPPFPGNPLDPPLRSRFQGFRVVRILGMLATTYERQRSG
jgi:hypothetical protein